jgi:DNA polymerase-3 subunit delta'
MTHDANLVSHILVCRDLEKAKEHVQNLYQDYRTICFFPEKEFSVEDAKEVVKEAYIAESKTKILILGAVGYNIYSQNSLLKILEEPPKNIVFILLGTAKTGFLPTIRSRLALKILEVQKEKKNSGLKLDALDAASIYHFVQANAKLGKTELKELVQTLVQEAICDYRLSFSESELQYFATLIELIELNSRANNILTSLLLNIQMRKK